MTLVLRSRGTPVLPRSRCAYRPLPTCSPPLHGDPSWDSPQRPSLEVPQRATVRFQAQPLCLSRDRRLPWPRSRCSSASASALGLTVDAVVAAEHRGHRPRAAGRWPGASESRCCAPSHSSRAGPGSQDATHVADLAVLAIDSFQGRHLLGHELADLPLVKRHPEHAPAPPSVTDADGPGHGRRLRRYDPARLCLSPPLPWSAPWKRKRYLLHKTPSLATGRACAHGLHAKSTAHRSRWRTRSGDDEAASRIGQRGPVRRETQRSEVCTSLLPGAYCRRPAVLMSGRLPRRNMACGQLSARSAASVVGGTLPRADASDRADAAHSATPTTPGEGKSIFDTTRRARQPSPVGLAFSRYALLHPRGGSGAV